MCKKISAVTVIHLFYNNWCSDVTVVASVRIGHIVARVTSCSQTIAW